MPAITNMKVLFSKDLFEKRDSEIFIKEVRHIILINDIL
jgi:hypothetical protein